MDWGFEDPPVCMTGFGENVTPASAHGVNLLELLKPNPKVDVLHQTTAESGPITLLVPHPSLPQIVLAFQDRLTTR
jgi:hypothetical protein